MVEPEEAAVVKIIYEKFVHEGMETDSICNYLNQRGYAKQKVIYGNNPILKWCLTNTGIQSD